MRRRGFLLLGLSWLVGCAGEKAAHSTSWLERLKPFQGPAGPDVVQIDIALLERPVGDHYLNHKLWNSTDEQVVPLEKKGTLEDNGFRVGQVGGIVPAELQALLTSERSCINPRRIQLRAENSTQVKLGPAIGDLHYQTYQDGRSTPLDLKDAQCLCAVTPSLTQDSRVRLHFTPQVQHGKASLFPRPAADRSGWIFQDQRPLERYPQLAWEVILAPSEYAVVGGRFDLPETLGHQCFIRTDEANPVQRLLVIRTIRSATGSTIHDAEADSSLSNSPPLAIQAAYPIVRGQKK